MYLLGLQQPILLLSVLKVKIKESNFWQSIVAYIKSSYCAVQAKFARWNVLVWKFMFEWISSVLGLREWKEIYQIKPWTKNRRHDFVFKMWTNKRSKRSKFWGLCMAEHGQQQTKQVRRRKRSHKCVYLITKYCFLLATLRFKGNTKKAEILLQLMIG